MVSVQILYTYTNSYTQKTLILSGTFAFVYMYTFLIKRFIKYRLVEGGNY